LGLHQSRAVQQAFENRLRRPVFEIPSLTPSVPGMRLHHILVQAIKKHGGRVFDGMEALSASTANRLVSAVHTETASRQRAHRFDRYLLATGGILGGGIDTDYQGNVREVVFNLPVQAPESRQDWFRRDFLDKQGHPIYQAGLRIDEQFQPVNGDNRPVYDNLFAAGTTLAGGEVIRERSFEGVAIATGYAASNAAAQQMGETT
jgi:glycerol-3-phosphate dehydrogenase subunit B